MFRRNGVFYVQDNLSGKQESLRTRNRADAERLFHARNEAAQGPMLNRDLGRVYLSASDPDSTKRTWSAVMEELRPHGITKPASKPWKPSTKLLDLLRSL